MTTKCEERHLKCENCEADTPWYPPLKSTNSDFKSFKLGLTAVYTSQHYEGYPKKGHLQSLTYPCTNSFFLQGRTGRHSPSNIDEFESDIALHSDKKSVSSRRSQSPTMTDSECQTARFEEQSVLSGSTVRTKQQEEELAKQQEQERMEAFKVTSLHMNKHI